MAVASSAASISSVAELRSRWEHLAKTSSQLSPGDVIATGTPGGVGDKRNPPLYMKAGDKVEVTIGAVGTLTNRIIDEQ